MHHIWDTIKIGAKQTIQSNAILWNKNNPSDLGTTEFTLETISESPKIFLINNCLSDDEVDKILELSKGKLKRSTIVSEDGSGLVLSDIRTSSTCWIKYSDDPVIENIFNRIADILKIDRNIVKYQASELLQVVNYQKSQEFKHHHDYLDPVYHIGNNAVMRGNNRMATFLFYLVTPEEGGETDFPLAKTEKSNDGLSLTLPKGSAILFYSMLPDGNLDELSLHAGLPVQKGEKSIANLWVWDRFFK
jgi:prolyl 4-hydroxylase